MKKIKRILLAALILSGILSCRNQNGQSDTPEKAGLHWNITVLADLSNRIDTARQRLQPPQAERDLAAVARLLKLFKTHIQSPGKGTFNSKDKFRILFHPLPDMENIENMVRYLSVDLETMEPKEKKRTFREMDDRILSTLRRIYERAQLQGHFEGSDIWGFMKEDVAIKCIESDSAYRNVLVILTDGYLYWKHDTRRQGNRFNYIERGEPHLTRFRATGRLEKEFDSGDYGFIVHPRDLSRLEVLVLELDHPKKTPQDFDTLKRYWGKWLAEMKAAKIAMAKTDLPVHTERVIEEFMKE